MRACVWQWVGVAGRCSVRVGGCGVVRAGVVCGCGVNQGKAGGQVWCECKCK